MDRFRLLERVGSGGMGTVYRAFDERLQREVAVKEIASSDPGRVAREAQAAARLNHPGIVTLYELGSAGGRALLVSELVEGATLAELARSGDLSDREVAEFGADVCEALAHAHERGVIHRDVKPQNVIVRVDDGAGRRAKLMDFGIASLVGAPTLTATGEVVGTLAYMAPEQAEGSGAAEPADVYSLALTLYECWTGFNPVARDTPAQTALQIGTPVPSVLEYRPDLPNHLAECLDTCLDPDPEVRPALDDLDHHLDTSIPRLDGMSTVPARGDEEPARPREHPGLLRVAQLAALCAWGIGTALLATAGDRPGLALVLGALTAPAILVASWLPWAGVPAVAPLLGAISAGGAYPAMAGSRGTLLERAVLGALGWWWMLCAAAVGLGSTGGLVDPAPADWTRSTSAAAKALLEPLVTPEALLGGAIFAVAAGALGLILRAGHIAVALLGALLWAAGLQASLQLVAGGALAGAPLLVAAAALIAVIVEFRRRGALHVGRKAPVPRAQPAMSGGEVAPG